MPKSHGALDLRGELDLRGIKKVPFSQIREGRFGRMFRRLPPMPPLEESVLGDLAEKMRDDNPPSGWGGTPETRDNPSIPAGYTYLGQLVDHDITFDPTSSLQRVNDPDALHNFRTPRFDLDSLYGSGPQDEPFQYRLESKGLALLVEPNRKGMEDLPRNSEGVALIGDPRNDENTIVGQLHLIFLKLHNKIGEQVLADDAVPQESKFEETQRRVRWHYQWVVVHDFLKRIVGEDLLTQLYIREPDKGPEIKLTYYHPKTSPYMPVEFSAAAFRYGHSQIRGIYNLNSTVVDRPIFISGPPPDEFADLRGFRPLPSQWTVDWNLFFTIGGSTPQPSRRIDSKLVPALFDLPDGGGSLPFRNLLRGQALELPSGQDVARYFKEERVLTGAELEAPEPTPLWFYILKESELIARGEHLGPVGGRVVAEVLLGLLKGDPQSWPNVNPQWTPTLPDADGDGEFTMPDLVSFATS
jgi:hypothetical protein